jgi:hypothetical protein
MNDLSIDFRFMQIVFSLGKERVLLKNKKHLIFDRRDEKS